MARPTKTTKKARAPKSGDQDFVMTTFRLTRRAVAEADTAKRVLGLSTRTAVVQFALGQLVKALPSMSTYSAEEIRELLDGYVKGTGK